MHRCTASLIALSWVLFQMTSGQESFHYNTFIGPVSGDVEEVAVPRTTYPSQYKGSYDSRANDDLTFDYVAKPDYKFVYGVEDPPTGNSHKHEEERNGDVVRGEYSVLEPDGAIRRVVYTADSKHGFRATVHRTPPPSSYRSPYPANRKELSTSAEVTSSTPLADDVNPTVATQSSLKPPDLIGNQERAVSSSNRFSDSKVEGPVSPVTSRPEASYADTTPQLDSSRLSDPIPESPPVPLNDNYNQLPYNEPPPPPVTYSDHTPSPYASDYNGPSDIGPYHGPNHIHSEPPPPPPPPYSSPYIHSGPPSVPHNDLPQYAPVHNDYYNPPPPPPPQQTFYSEPQYHSPLNIPHSPPPPPPPPPSIHYHHFADRRDPIYPIYPSHPPISPIPHHHQPPYYGDYAY